MDHLFLFLCLFLSTIEGDDYPQINELFGIESKRISVGKSRRSNQAAKKDKKYMFDLETLEMDEFRKTLDKLGAEIVRKSDGKSRRDFGDDDARRQVPKRGKMNYRWRDAVDYTMAQKALDAMLTIIFMARRKIKEIEKKSDFNKNSIAFKIAFVYEKLLLAKHYVDSCYSHMAEKMEKIQAMTQTDYEQRKYYHLYSRYWLIQHHVLANRHANYVYLWWVFVKMHEAYCNDTKTVMERPTIATTLLPPT